MWNAQKEVLLLAVGQFEHLIHSQGWLDYAA